MSQFDDEFGAAVPMPESILSVEELEQSWRLIAARVAEERRAYDHDWHEEMHAFLEDARGTASPNPFEAFQEPIPLTPEEAAELWYELAAVIDQLIADNDDVGEVGFRQLSLVHPLFGYVATIAERFGYSLLRGDEDEMLPKPIANGIAAYLTYMYAEYRYRELDHLERELTPDEREQYNNLEDWRGFDHLRAGDELAAAIYFMLGKEPPRDD